jgi:hypothetical protein
VRRELCQCNPSPPLVLLSVVQKLRSRRASCPYTSPCPRHLNSMKCMLTTCTFLGLLRPGSAQGQ